MLVCSWQWTLCFWHILSGNVQSQDIRYFRSTDMWLMWWKNVIQKEPEIQINHPFPLWLWNVKIFKPWSFPGRKKQTRWKFCGGVGWGAICEGLKETNVQDQLIFPWLLDIVCQRIWGIVRLFELRKLFERKLLSILKLFEKKPWAKHRVCTCHDAMCCFPKQPRGQQFPSLNGCRIQSLPSLLVSTRWTRTTCPA